MEFLNYFVSTSLCCPSRATIIKGQYCHNHGIWDNGDLNSPTFLSGGIRKAIETNLEEETIATLMKEAGYETFLIGKYLMGQSDQYAYYVPPGWDHWHSMTDTSYYGPHFSIDGKLFKADKHIYQTDYISMHARNMIESRDKSKPFFVYIAPFAPHGPATPAKRHEHLFSDVSAPRSVAFNPDDHLQKQKPSWMKTMPKLTAGQIASIDAFYRNRLRSLQAVDEMLENITLLLKKEGIDDNTYLFYMGDNGQHLGEYRLPAGKRQAYDTDIRVPFLVKGPGITGGTKVTEVVMSVDLMPTWLELGKGKMPKTYDPDGLSIVPFLHSQSPTEPAENVFRAAALAEMYGGTSSMGRRYGGVPEFYKSMFWNNTYQAVRVINGSDWAKNADWLYVEWCTGEKEFYNVSSDKRQIYNIIYKVEAGLLQKLSVLTKTLGSCSGKSCHSIDLARIAETAKHWDFAKYHIQCHNPPNIPQEVALGSYIWADLTSMTDDKELCGALISRGFPYSDDEVVSEKEMEVWQHCLHKI